MAGLVYGPDWGPREPTDIALPQIAGDAGQPIEIIAFGTSLTATYDWPEILGRRLESCLSRPVDMSVLARPGAGSDWAMTVLEEAASAQADLVLVEFMINDADLTDGASFARSQENHERLIEALREDSAVLLLTMNPVTGIKRLTRPALGRYYGMTEDLARTHDLGRADLTPRWRVFLDRGGALPDGLHPAPEDAAALLPGPLAAIIAPAFGQSCPFDPSENHN